jgi:hypothetical protein
LIFNRAEYPLQWLGEHLINQSFLYENNPDATGIKERFFYNFDPEPSGDDAAAAAGGGGESIPAASVTTPSAIDPQCPGAERADPMPQQQLHNGEQDAVDGLMAETDETYDVSEQMDLGPGHGEAHTDMLNGIAEAARDEVAAEHDDGLGQAVLDTEMAGAT